MTIKNIIILLLLLTVFYGCAQKTNSEEKLPSRINGVSFVASSLELEEKFVQPIVDIHANYAAIMPFGFIESLDHPEIFYNSDRQWFGETMEGAKQYIAELHKKEIKVMLKPHIWVWHGEFTGMLKMANEEDWKSFELSYEKFIMDFAILAETEKVDMFCIGTELESFIVHRPEYWVQLITKIRGIYHGKLTYAANWDEYKRVSFWEYLDYIGVDAYFPIAMSQTPTIDEAKLGWVRWKTEMEKISDKTGKKIIFTEYGYRSVDFAGKEPWQATREMKSLNFESQKNLLQALYEEVWNEPWFAGGFLWKWFVDGERVDGTKDTQFSPQNKPAAEVVKRYYML